MNYKKITIFGVLWLITSVSNGQVNMMPAEAEILLAAVNFSEEKASKPKSKPKPKSKSRSIKRTVVKPEIKQYEIEGYIDKEYIRAVLEMENDKYIVGNIYDKSGKETYVHGEYVDGAMHVYDKKGKHFTIVVDKK